MNIDLESIGVLSLVLQDSPKEREFILCILARSNSLPTRITFHPNTDYPTFYGYSNSRIPLYLMGKGVLSNVPREGYIKRLISSHYLSYAETIINGAKTLDTSQKLMSVSQFITLENKTAYKDAEVFCIFRGKALAYIKEYAILHQEEVSSFLGTNLSREVFKTEFSVKPGDQATEEKKESKETITASYGKLRLVKSSLPKKINLYYENEHLTLNKGTQTTKLLQEFIKRKRLTGEEMLSIWNRERTGGWRKEIGTHNVSYLPVIIRAIKDKLKENPNISSHVKWEREKNGYLMSVD